MTAYRITYQGPAELAIEVATLVADAEGIDLTASPGPSGGSGDEATLVLTVAGSEDSIQAAAERVREQLPAGATLTVDAA